MIPKELSSHQRNQLRRSYLARMDQTDSVAWRQFWMAHVSFLDGETSDALARLRDVSAEEEREVAIAALAAIGEWYESAGSLLLAQQAYRQAIEEGGNVLLTARASIQLAHLYNSVHEPALALTTLDPLVAEFAQIPDDLVQFLVVEQCQALRELGRVAEVRTFLRRAIRAFPNRAELPMIEEELLGQSG